MTDEEKRLAGRFEELSSRSFNKGIWVYSDFLTTAQQAMLQAMKLGAVTFCGGYDGAERRVACFGSEDMCGYEACPECVWLAIEPVARKFADELTHRDFFGSVMALGLRREVLGDIIVYEAPFYEIDGEGRYLIRRVTGVRNRWIEVDRGNAPADPASVIGKEQVLGKVIKIWERRNAS